MHHALWACTVSFAFAADLCWQGNSAEALDDNMNFLQTLTQLNDRSFSVHAVPNLQAPPLAPETIAWTELGPAAELGGTAALANEVQQQGEEREEEDEDADEDKNNNMETEAAGGRRKGRKTTAALIEEDEEGEGEDREEDRQEKMEDEDEHEQEEEEEREEEQEELEEEQEEDQGKPEPEQGEQLGRELASAGSSAAEGATKQFLESFKICGTCNSFQRLGEAHDGGYLMCMDSLKKGSIQAAYSVGVGQYDKWSQDVMNLLGVPVHQIDCTVSESWTKDICTGCTFFKKCIASSDGKDLSWESRRNESELWSLTKLLSETSQENAADGSLLMKMDIEGAEWPFFASESPDMLRKFGQLVVEFHALQFEAFHPLYVKALQQIFDAGFKVAHIHGNNWGMVFNDTILKVPPYERHGNGLYQTGNASIPYNVEVTFVHGAARPGGCTGDQIYNRLDTPNNPSWPELPMMHIA